MVLFGGIVNFIDHRNQYDFDMCCFLSSFFKFYIDQEITNFKISKET